MLFPSAPEGPVNLLKAALAKPINIAITTHYNPDGDALGSSLGLARVLRLSGHTVNVVLPNTPSVDLQWMPGYSGCIAGDTAKQNAEQLIRECDLLFCLDFNRPDRVNGLELALLAAKDKVLIDHHRDPAPFARINFSDIRACATAQIVFDVIGALGLADLIDVEVATCLYTGVLTDSGSFRFSSTTPHTMHVAAELMARGAVPDRIHSAIMDNNTVDRMRLFGFALSERMEHFPELHASLIVLSKEDLARFNYRQGDTEGLVNQGLTIRGNRLAAFIVERPEVVKLSMRSKGPIPVNEFLAKHFEGGGHANAAGGHSALPLSEVVGIFKRELPVFLQKHPVE